MLSRGRPLPNPTDPLGLRRIDATQAARLIADEIARVSPITFHRFMELALYDPEVGYYARAASGPGLTADYVTSPELHGAFGTLLTRQIDELWRFLNHPEPFWFIEGGPGTGRLAAVILSVADAAYPDLARSLRVALIERCPRLAALQNERLAPWKDRINWLDAAPSTWSCLGPGCIIANELLDAFPVHRLVGTTAGIRERMVGIDAGRFVEVEGPLSDPALAEQVSHGGGCLPPGSLGEVSLAAAAWVAAAAELVDRGYLLLIDYGEPADTLYGPNQPLGTLRSYGSQALLEDPLALPGQRDLTAHVDLSAVTRAGLEASLALVGSTHQASFLDRLGLPGLIARVDQQVEGRPAQHAHRRALESLRDPNGLGNLAVLLFAKNSLDSTPVGFGDDAATDPPDVAATWRLG